MSVNIRNALDELDLSKPVASQWPDFGPRPSGGLELLRWAVQEAKKNRYAYFTTTPDVLLDVESLVDVYPHSNEVAHWHYEMACKRYHKSLRDDAVVHAQHGRQIAKELGNEMLAARCEHIRAISEWFERFDAASFHDLIESVEASCALEGGHASFAIANLSRAYSDIQEGEEGARQAIRAIENAVNDAERAWGWTLLAMNYRVCGADDSRRAANEQMSRLLPVVPRSQLRAWILYTLAAHRYYDGAKEEALNLYEEIAEIMSSLGDESTLRSTRYNQAEILTEIGQLDQALVLVKDILEYDSLKTKNFRDQECQALVKLFLARGDHASAYQYQQELLTLQPQLKAARVAHELRLRDLKRELEIEKSQVSKLKAREVTLELQVEHKAKHLAQFTQLTETFKSEIKQLLQQATTAESAIRSVKSKLSILPDRIDLATFQSDFYEAYPYFETNLRQQIPAITPMQIRISMLMRMQFSVTDSARLLSLSERNIENHRYRLRKLFGLTRDQNLSDFLQQF